MLSIIDSQEEISSKHLKSRWVLCLAFEKAILIDVHFRNTHGIPAIISFIHLKETGNDDKTWDK